MLKAGRQTTTPVAGFSYWFVRLLENLGAPFRAGLLYACIVPLSTKLVSVLHSMGYSVASVSEVP